MILLQLNTRPQRAFKLLNVIKNLRRWEICSPDISAAIEYCRENIVEMTVEEYEDWFKANFIDVERPKTAPAATTNTRQGATKNGSGTSNPRQQSAVPSIRKL